MAQQVNFFTTTLAQALTQGGSETEIYVSSITTLDGETVSTADFSVLGKGYLTIDPQSSQRVERISFTGVDATNVGFTGAVRGLYNIGGSGNTTANANYHPVGAPVIISFGADDLSDILAYIASTSYAGTVNASASVKGIVQLPTQAQVDARTANGSTGAALSVIPATLRSTLLSDYAVDTGAANAYVIAPSPVITAYAMGQIFSFKAGNLNTTASTLAVNGLAAKNIYFKQAALTGGEIAAGSIVVVEYDGTQFQMVSSASNTYNSIPPSTQSTLLYTSLIAAESIAAGDALAVGPYQSDGGVMYDASAVSSVAAVGNASTIAFTVGNHTNRLLVVAVQHAGTSISGITWKGDALTSAANLGYTGSTAITVYYMVAPTVGTWNLVISGLNGTETFGYGIYSYYNVSQSALSNVVTKTQASLSNISKSVTPANVGSVMLSVVGRNAGPSNTDVNMNNNNGTVTYGSTFNFTLGDSYKMPNLNAITVSETTSGTPDWGLVNMELVPVTAATFRVSKATSSTGATTGWNTGWKDIGFVGFSSGVYALNVTTTIITDGVVTGLSSLQPGMIYYLNDTAGTIGNTAGTTTRKVGIATSATTLLITNEP